LVFYPKQNYLAFYKIFMTAIKGKTDIGQVFAKPIRFARKEDKTVTNAITVMLLIGINTAATIGLKLAVTAYDSPTIL
jgi:hypothetical protein